MTTETISSDAAEGADLLATAQQALEDLKAVDPSYSTSASSAL